MPAQNTRDLAGLKFGRLTALRQVGRRKFPAGGSHAVWECLCECGALGEYIGGALVAGHTRSCGCIRKETSSNLRHGHARTGQRSSTWKAWASLKQRAAGLHPRWEVFENFLADMGEKPAGMEVDRIDNARGYEPGNCRWATRTQQVRNRTITVFVEHAGERLPMAELAERHGLPLNTVRLRWRKGDREQRLVRPLQKHRGGVLVRNGA